MKILITAEQLQRSVPGGIGTYAKGLIKGLSELGADFDVHKSKLPVKVLTKAWDLGFARTPSGYDVVHATSFATPPKATTKMTAMVHDIAWRSHPETFPSRGRRWHEAALKRIIDKADAIFVPSSFVADQLVHSGVKDSRVFVTGEGSDHLPAPDHESAAAKLASAGVSGDYVLSIGTLEPRKNLLRLIEAFNRTKGQFQNPTQLVIVGPIGWGEELTPVKDVVLLGYLTEAEIASLYAKCALFAYVPLSEGYGLPVVEAMSMGAPVVSSAVPSSGGATLQVDPEDIDSISRGILLAATDGDVRTELISLGKERSDATTWKLCAGIHLDTWKTL